MYATPSIVSVNGSVAFAVASFPLSVVATGLSFGLDMIQAAIDDAARARPISSDS